MKAGASATAEEEGPRRQSLLIAEAARDPDSDEAAVMREIDAELEDTGSGNEGAA